MTNKWNARLKKLILEQRIDFGWCCVWCGDYSCIEFAHLEKTGMDGSGRGRSQRYYDVKKHKEEFLPMCMDCHRFFDRCPIIKLDDLSVRKGTRDFEN